MANRLTPFINEQNVQNIRAQIARKKGYNPYLATVEESSDVLTDHDTFPYPRWYRGVPTSSQPIVAEREAGWRPRHDNCYRVLKSAGVPTVPYPTHCFEAACSTTFPCYPKISTKNE